MDDAEIKALVARLSRPHPSGGAVIERAAILAEGGDFQGILAWITANAGEAEAVAPRVERHGIHGARQDDHRGDATPLRFVLPPGALA
jgi:hypothetical protein